MRILFRLLPVLFIGLVLAACSEKRVKTTYTHVIPGNALQVTYCNLQSLAQKADIGGTENEALRQQLLFLLVGQNSPELNKQFELLCHRPEETGIDWTSPLYLFRTPSLYKTNAILRIADLEKWESLVDTFAKEGLCTPPVHAEGYSSIDLSDIGMQLAYNDGTLFVVHAGSMSELRKLQPAISALMMQDKEHSIHAHPHFAAMTAQKGDIRMLATSEVIPFRLRGALKYPQGTQLLGRMLFENGRVYATIRQADFEGETNESTQPFRPSSQMELQQAMYHMSSGYPFHIEFTEDELLTLTNLRALMEFTPDDPEVKSLYDLVMCIESLSARGDKRSTSFTLVLKEANVNSLKQLVDYGKQLSELL